MIKTSFIIPFACLCACAACCGAAETVTVAGVQEGAKLLVKRAGSIDEVRLYGVDCPASGQAQFEAAKAFTERLALNQDVALEERAKDSTGKAVVEITLADKTSLAEALLKEGLAWWDEVNASGAADLKKLNAAAIAGQTGIFKDAAALAPWDYRKSHGMPAVDYKVIAPPAPAPAPEPAKKLMAKGTGLYEEKEKGGGDVIDASKLNIDKDAKIDLMGLAAKHQPRIATDKDGKPQGFTASDIEGIPYASALGLKNDDIISSINGMPITSMGDIMPMVQRLNGVKDINAVIIRNGQPVPINVHIP